MKITRLMRSKKKLSFGIIGVLLVALFVVVNILPREQNVVTEAAPAGFNQRQVVSGLSRPTAMTIAPDGRIFVAEKSGKLRVIKNGSLLSTPFVSVSASTDGERGLLGVALDPQFSQNKFVYVYYTASGPKNRVSRFTASNSNADVVQSGSEMILLDNIPSKAIYHNGGAVHFGTDGKLYIAVGDNQNGSNAQITSTLAGKILRINKDGSIPTDNPFYNSASGNNRAIWALGFRNPFTFAVNPTDGTIFVNDVGSDGSRKREEINRLERGKNYGWSNCEGSCSNSAYTNPIYFYGAGVGSTIAGGTFYTGTQFPTEYRGRYFFGDFLGGWIRRLNPSNNQTADFASGLGSPVDVDMGPDGALYFISHNEGSISKIFHGTVAPTVPPSQGTPTNKPTPTNNPTSAPIRTPTPTKTPVPTQSTNRPPVASVNTPVAASKYKAGDTVTFSGTATDPEDGVLPASAFHWTVETSHNDSHTHPFNEYAGVKTGSFKTLNELGEADASIKYRIILKVTDSKGATHQITRDVLPVNSTFTVTTNPPGLTVLVDGQPRIAPVTFTGVVGYKRLLSTQSGQRINNIDYLFSSWSDGKPLSHTIDTPAVNTTYTATFVPASGPTRTPTPIKTPIPTLRSTPVPTRTPTPTKLPATPTPLPGSYILRLDESLHGIGQSGDSVKAGSGNINPKRKSRTITIELFDPENLQEPVLTRTGTITYDPASGSFKGTADLGNSLSEGEYLSKAYIEGYLENFFDGILTLRRNETIDISGDWITGDTDTNNSLDIFDYNNILSCYGALYRTSSCIFPQTTDLDDNGVVDGVDYNLFLRELSVPHD